MEQWKNALDEIADLQTVAPKSRKILDNDAVYLVFPHQLDQLLHGGTLKVRAAESVVDKLPNLSVCRFGHR